MLLMSLSDRHLATFVRQSASRDVGRGARREILPKSLGHDFSPAMRLYSDLKYEYADDEMEAANSLQNQFIYMPFLGYLNTFYPCTYFANGLVPVCGQVYAPRSDPLLLRKSAVCSLADARERKKDCSAYGTVSQGGPKERVFFAHSSLSLSLPSRS